MIAANPNAAADLRNGIRITEVLANLFDDPIKLEDACLTISRELLERHEYASRAEVKAFGEAVFERKTPRTGMLTFESFEIMASATFERNGDGVTSAFDVAVGDCCGGVGLDADLISSTEGGVCREDRVRDGNGTVVGT